METTSWHPFSMEGIRVDYGVGTCVFEIRWRVVFRERLEIRVLNNDSACRMALRKSAAAA